MADWWHEKSLAELSASEWEALCDGCAKCCLHKLEDEDSGEVYYTKVRCRYLNEKTCSCTDYERRSTLMPNCIDLRSADWNNIDWLPSTCAYRLRSHGEQLPGWHPLVSGSRDSVHSDGVSICGRAISDEYVHPDGFEEHIVHWVE
ncbi:MAG: YcgN family cysteine cluster protein [Halioglobus sp.]|nr:YcgN family cysteine cluster protein [Halioglobus sp.]